MLGSAISLASARAPIAPWWPAGARYAADFTRGLYMRDGQLIPASQAFSFTRASSKIAQGRDGRWTSFGVDVPCITERGILLEPERQNTALNSSWFEHWGLVRATVTPNGRLGIDGTMSADLITASSSNINGAFAGASSQTVVPGLPYTFSMIVERANSDWVALMATTADFLHRQTVWFNLATGAVGSTSGVGSEIVLAGAATIEVLGAAQYQVGMTVSTSATITPAFRLYLCDGNGALAVSLGTNVWALHGQVEAGEVASSPIITFADVHVRAVDVLLLQVPTSAEFASLTFEDGPIEVIDGTQPYEVPTSVRLCQAWCT